ncbi:MAG: hypothetical protein GY853_10265 [PVC group bacterium]|nr:hypothetical protein [PVC group bacterium]
MGNYSKKSNSKPLIISVAVTIVILIFLVAALATGIFFSTHKEVIEKEVSSYLNQELSIGSIHYFPPCFIILKDVSISEDDAAAGHPPLAVERITLVFSLREIINKKGLTITKLYFIKPKVDFFKYPLFFKENVEGIIAIVNLLAKGKPIHIVMEDALLILDRKGQSVSAVSLTTRLKVGAGRVISSRGKIDMVSFLEGGAKKEISPVLSTQPLQYAFDGAIALDGLAIDNIELTKGDFHASLEGKLKQNVLRLKGGSSIENFYDMGIPEPGRSVEFARNLRHLLLYKRLPRKSGFSPGGLNILDVNCVINFASRKIGIEDFSFSVDNMPVQLAGDITFEDKTFFNMKFSSIPARNPANRSRDKIRKLDVYLKGQIDEGKTDCISNLYVVRIANKQEVLHKIATEITGASFGFSPDRRLKLFMDGFFLSSKSGDDSYSLDFKNVNALFNLLNSRVKFVKFDSEIYEGGLTGHAAMDLGYIPFKTNVNFMLEDVNARQLDTLLLSLVKPYRKLPGDLPGRVEGTFDCEISYVSYPRSTVKGKVNITDGYLDNVQFFIWLAEFFSIPSLNHVEFKKIFSEFSVLDEDRFSFETIKLDATDIQLDGFFKLQENDLVSSKLSLSLPRKILAGSPKFQLLLKLVGRDIPSLGFDFQLSGSPKALNFKWLEGDFKKRIEKILPGFIERGIERKIETAVQSIRTQ